MSIIKVSIDKIYGILEPVDLELIKERVEVSNRMLSDGSGDGNDFLGWVDLPEQITPAQLDAVNDCAKSLASLAEVIVVIGIGGSYLGAKAVLEAMSDPFQLLHKKQDKPIVLFAGQNLSEDYLYELLAATKPYKLAAIVISKSGTTTEPAVAFRIVKEEIETRYGKAEAAKRIVAVTDAKRGALRTLATQEGYETFVVPDNVGGRYSVLTAVGLLPIAVAGVDTDALLAGAREMEALCEIADYTNPAWQYAAMRHELYRQGKKVELLACFEPAFRFMAEWWKQLYGESEGKEEKGLFPASVDFTADLHSMGQYIQQGERMLMETVVRFAPAEQQMVVPFDEANGDGLNFLAGKTMDFINRQAMDGTLLAHVEGGVPNIILNLDENNARTMGQLIYFFEYACGLSGYLLGVNPFDQPGVEAYKKNMFALLGKPGYEEMGEELRKRLR